MMPRRSDFERAPGLERDFGRPPSRWQYQAELAGRIGVRQANISRIENRGEILVSTLSKMIAAVGATLTITARLPDGRERRLDL